jgi:hypothetical protein
MSTRLMTVSVAAMLLMSGGIFGGLANAADSGLNFEIYRTQVEPIFLKKREGMARCYQCHEGANNGLSLEPLADGQTAYTEEQSRSNFERVSQVAAGGVYSRLLTHPLAPEAGGDLFHSGGRQFKSKDDPEYRILEAWATAQ